MAWDDDSRRLAVAAIGKVESHLDYSSINYGDPITVGIAQWYGVRAASVLLRMKNENAGTWNGVAPSLDNDLAAHSANSTFWNTRYLTRGEGNSIIPVLKANSSIQDDQLSKDIDGYADVARQHGLNPDTNTNTFILFATAWHQGPRYALQVLSLVGGEASLESFRDGCLNHSVLGQYVNRYNDAYRIIKNNDTSGVGNIGNSSPLSTRAGSSVAPNQITGDITHVSQNNDGTLFIHTLNGIVRCYPTTIGYWTVGENNSASIGAPSSPSSPIQSGGDPERKKIVDWMLSRINKFAYSQGPNRLNPDESEYGDCSSIIWRAYKDVLGINVGTWTGDQVEKGVEVVKGAGRMPASAVALLKPGDLIVMGWDWTTSGQHVEMSLGDLRHIGHGGPDDGPDIGENISEYLADAVWWNVRRHIND